MRHSLVCFILILVWNIPEQANEIIGPNWNSNRILEVRGQSQGDVIILAVRSEIRTSDNPVSITSGIAQLASDFDYVAIGEDRTIADYRYCRVLNWKEAETIFANHSCFASPAFRKIELGNRLLLDKVLGEIAPSIGQSLGFDKVWLEQEFAMQLSPSDPLSLVETEKGMEWRFDDQVVAAISLNGFVFDAQDRQRFTRYLSRHLNLHPQVRDAILRGID